MVPSPPQLINGVVAMWNNLASPSFKSPKRQMAMKPVGDLPPLDWVPGGSHFVAVEPICRPTERSAPLWMAAHNGHVEVVQLLVMFGANNTNSRTTTDRTTDGWTPRSAATFRGHFALLSG
jgi:hypothetical protein